MKKTYIAPEMSMTTINSGEILLALSGSKANDSDALGKERRPRGEEPKDEAWGNLW